MIPRRRAREIALQVLYAQDFEPEMEGDRALATFFHNFGSKDDDDEIGAGEQFDKRFTEDLVRGVVSRRAELDDVLAQLSRTWRIERMARVDRSVLRLAIFELKHRDDIPARVTINEAVELAKRFGAAEASAFVNGVLDSAVGFLGVRK